MNLVDNIAALKRLQRLPRHMWDGDYDAELAEAENDLREARIEELLTSPEDVAEALGYATDEQLEELAALDAKMFQEMKRGYSEEATEGVYEIAEKRKKIIWQIFSDHEELLR